MTSVTLNLRTLMDEQSDKVFGLAYIPMGETLAEYVLYWSKTAAKREYSKVVKQYGQSSVVKLGF